MITLRGVLITNFEQDFATEQESKSAKKVGTRKLCEIC